MTWINENICSFSSDNVYNIVHSNLLHQLKNMACAGKNVTICG